MWEWHQLEMKMWMGKGDKLLSTIPLLSAGDDRDSEVVVASLGGLKAENGVAAGCVDCLANLCRGC